MSEPSYTPDFDIDAKLPPKWGDRTTIVYTDNSGEDDAEIAANVAITRDARPESEAFSVYVSNQINALANGIEGFRIINRREGEINGRPASDIACLWPTPGEDIRQRFVFIDAGKPRVVCFVATAESPKFSRHEAAFNSILSSLSIFFHEDNDS